MSPRITLRQHHRQEKFQNEELQPMVKHGLLSRILVIHNALISSGAHSRVSILAIPYPDVRAGQIETSE